MSGSCQLSLELEEPDDGYRAGGQLRGVVDVAVTEDTECDGLLVVCYWEVQGLGPATAGRKHEVEVFCGDLEGERRYSYSFDLQLPNGPCSYTGKHVNVHWVVELRAELSAKDDRIIRRDIELLPPVSSVDEPYRTGNPASSYHEEAESRVESSTPLWQVIAAVVVATPFIAGGLALVGLSVTNISGDPGFILGVGIGLFVAGFPAYRLWDRMLREKVAEIRLGEVDVQVADTTVSPEDKVEIEVSIPADREAMIEEVVIGLKGWERVRYQAEPSTQNNSGKRTEIHLVHLNEREVEASRERTRKNEELLMYRTELFVPEDAPPTFHAFNSELCWAVVISVDVSGGPGWSNEVPLDVIPTTATGSEGNRGQGDDGDRW